MNSKSLIIISLLSSIILLGIYSCKKDPNTFDVSGKVTDSQIGTNLSGAAVVLRASKVQSGIYNSSYVDVLTVNTASNGLYQMEVTEEKVSGYRFYVSKDGYFDELIDVNTEDLQINDGYTQNFSLDPIGNIILKVKNTTPQGMDDEVRYRFKNVNAQCKDCWNNEINIGIGPTYSSEQNLQVIGERALYIEWVVKKGGQQHIYQDTVHSISSQTVTYNINY